MPGQLLSRLLGIGRELILAAAFPFRVYVRDLFFYVVVSCGLAGALCLVLLPNRNTGYQR
jgi:peptidoglycan biosynthesis protein MviN/MurJ (putative lipid II flippase)